MEEQECKIGIKVELTIGGAVAVVGSIEEEGGGIVHLLDSVDGNITWIHNIPIACLKLADCEDNNGN